MWWFFRHEFKTYNPSNEVAAIAFIVWMFLAVILPGIAVTLLAKIYTPKNEGDANAKRQ